MQHLQAHPSKFPLHLVLLPACEQLGAGPAAGACLQLEPVRSLVHHTIEQLEQKTAGGPPQAAASWAREVELGCRCADCQAVAVSHCGWRCMVWHDEVT